MRFLDELSRSANPIIALYAKIETLVGPPERVEAHHTAFGAAVAFDQRQAKASTWSTDCQLDRLADTAEHFHERIDRELGRFFIHHV